MVTVYEVPKERRPKRIRSRKGRDGRCEFVTDYGDGIVVVMTYEEMLARAKRRAEGRGLRS